MKIRVYVINYERTEYLKARLIRLAGNAAEVMEGKPIRNTGGEKVTGGSSG